MTIRDTNFIECLILGPAILAPLGDWSLHEGHFFADAVEMVWPVAMERDQMVGAIAMRECAFINCTFRRIGFAMLEPRAAAFRAQLEKAFRWTPDQATGRAIAVSAVCETCRRRFATDFIVEDNHTLITAGAKVGPCPHCGGIGSIPDGAYTIASLMRELSAEATHEELTGLEQALSGLGSDPTGEDAAAAVEAAPSRWHRLGAYLRPASGADLSGYVSLILELVKSALGG